MWNIKRILFKDKGFTLIELILALGISSIVIITLFTILNFSARACDLGEQKDDLILNSRYAIEFIKGEVREADKIISPTQIIGLNNKYPNNLGFVVMIREEGDKFRYITYYVKDSKLLRIACTRETDIYPIEGDFGGHNTVSEFVDSMEESQFDVENSIVLLDFKFKHRDEELKIKTDIYIICPIDF